MKLELVVEHYEGDTGEFIKVDEAKCTGCGLCAKICPTGVWQKVGDIYKPVNLKECMECGACWDVCAPDAIDYGEPRGGTGVRFRYG